MSQSEQDVNEIFDNIFLKEDATFTETFRQGYKIGKSEENWEAFHLGFHRGAEIGAEIGYYMGFIKFIKSKKREEFDLKLSKDFETLEALLINFPRENNADVDFLDTLNEIRAKFKKVSSVLKLRSDFSASESLSF